MCPCCPFVAKKNAHGAVRTDNLRRHVFAHHNLPNLAYVDKYGSVLEGVTATLVMTRKPTGKLDYIAAFCFECGSWLTMSNGSPTAKRDYVIAHTCRVIQKRAPKKCKTPETAAQAKVAEAKESAIIKELKRHGLDDHMVLTDNYDLDLSATFKEIAKALNKPAASISVIDQLKKENGLVALKLDKLVAERLAFVQEAEDNHDSEDEDYEPEVYNEINDILVPILLQYVKAAPIRERLSATISALKVEKDKLEDQVEQLKSSAVGAEEDLNERIMDLSRQLTEETRLRHAAEARLKEKSVVVAAPKPDKIQIVGENSFVQWSLPFQG